MPAQEQIMETQRALLEAAYAFTNDGNTKDGASSLRDLFRSTIPLGYTPDARAYAVAAAALFTDAQGRASYCGNGAVIEDMMEYPSLSAILQEYCFRRSGQWRDLEGEPLKEAVAPFALAATERSRDVMDRYAPRHESMMNGFEAGNTDIFDAVAIACTITLETECGAGKLRTEIDDTLISTERLDRQTGTILLCMSGKIDDVADDLSLPKTVPSLNRAVERDLTPPAAPAVVETEADGVAAAKR